MNVLEEQTSVTILLLVQTLLGATSVPVQLEPWEMALYAPVSWMFGN